MQLSTTNTFFKTPILEILWKGMVYYWKLWFPSLCKGGNTWTGGLPTSLIGKSYQGEETRNGELPDSFYRQSKTRIVVKIFSVLKVRTKFLATIAILGRWSNCRKWPFSGFYTIEEPSPWLVRLKKSYQGKCIWQGTILSSRTC